MMKPTYLLLGDTHGSMHVARTAIGVAVAYDVTTIFQLGDWGYVWPGADRVEALSALLVEAGVTMVFIDGNHDMHHVLPTLTTQMYPNLVYVTRGDVLVFGGVRVGFLGGAASIDQDVRTPGKDWWPSEQITSADVHRLTPCDVLLTHDAPAMPFKLPKWPWPVSYDVQRQLNHSRAMVALAVERTKPSLLVHGHYHFAYKSRWLGSTTVRGLSADGNPGSMLLVDERFEPCF